MNIRKILYAAGIFYCFGVQLCVASSASLNILIPAPNDKITLSGVPFSIPVKGNVTPPQKLVGMIKWKVVIEGNQYEKETDLNIEDVIRGTEYPVDNSAFGENKEIIATANIDKTPPVIYGEWPPNGSDWPIYSQYLYEYLPNGLSIIAYVIDKRESSAQDISGLKKIVLTVDGQIVNTKTCKGEKDEEVSINSLSRNYASLGMHYCRVVAEDMADNQSECCWSYSISDALS